MSDRRDFLKNLTAATAASSLLAHRAQGRSAHLSLLVTVEDGSSTTTMEEICPR